MDNPLIESCARLSQLGYSGNVEVSLPWEDPTLLMLGKYLLNNSGLPVTYSLKTKARESDRVAICFGGGIDSYCAMIHALSRKKKVTLVHVNYGQPYFRNERLVLSNIVRAWGFAFSGVGEVSVISEDFRRLMSAYDLQYGDLRFVQEEKFLIPQSANLDFSWKDYIIPCRNLVLAAVGSAEADEVWVIANKRRDETVGTPDKTSLFYRLTSAVFTGFWGRKIIVRSPFLTMSKLGVVKKYLELGGNMEALKQTFSCYTPGSLGLEHCGLCYACYKRFKLFQALNVEYSFKAHPQNGKHFAEFEAQEKAKGR